MSLAMYEFFKNGNYINESNVPLVSNYISSNLNSWSPNQRYWEKQYHILTKLYIVCKWRKENGFRPLTKRGQRICNNELINYFADEKHKTCSCSTI